MKKILMLGKTEVKRSRGWQRMGWLNRIPDSVDMNLSKLWEIVEIVIDFIFGAPKSLQMVTTAMKSKDAYSLEGQL